MAPCLEGLLNTAPSTKAPERRNEGEISDWAQPGLQHRANTTATPHLSMRIPLPPCVQCVCVCVCVSLHVCCVGDEEHVCAHVLVYAKKVLAKSAAAFILTHWFYSIWSIYPENEQPNFPSFFFNPVVSFPDTTPPSPFSPSFDSLYLIISSSPAVWLFPPVSNRARDTTWSCSPPPGMPLIPTFPSPSKVRSLDRSPAVELRDIFWWKHPAACSSFLLPLHVAGVSQRFRVEKEAGERRFSLCILQTSAEKASLTTNEKPWKDQIHLFFCTLELF